MYDKEKRCADIAAKAIADTLLDDRVESLALDSHYDRITLSQIFGEHLGKILYGEEK